MRDLVDLLAANRRGEWPTDDDTISNTVNSLCNEASDMTEFDDLEPEPSIIIERQTEDTTMSKRQSKPKAHIRSYVTINDKDFYLGTGTSLGIARGRAVKLLKQADLTPGTDPVSAIRTTTKQREWAGKGIDAILALLTEPDAAPAKKTADDKASEKETKPEKADAKGEEDDPDVIMELLEDESATPDKKEADEKPDAKAQKKKVDAKKSDTKAKDAKKPDEEPETEVKIDSEPEKKYVAGKDMVDVPDYKPTHKKLFGSMSAAELKKLTERAVAELGKLLKEGDSVITVVRTVTKSKFNAKCHIFARSEDGELVNITEYIKSLENKRQDSSDVFLLRPENNGWIRLISKAVFGKEDALDEMRI